MKISFFRIKIKLKFYLHFKLKNYSKDKKGIFFSIKKDIHSHIFDSLFLNSIIFMYRSLIVIIELL
jgi:hypothetical protein